MGGSSIQKHQRTIILVLAFILLRTLFALVWDVVIVSAGRNCSPYADKVYDQLGVRAVGQVACKSPDEKYATVGYEPGSFLVLDMGVENEINEQPGIDLIYYSGLEGGSLAPVEVSVALGNDEGPGEFVVVYVWAGGPHES